MHYPSESTEECNAEKSYEYQYEPDRKKHDVGSMII